MQNAVKSYESDFAAETGDTAAASVVPANDNKRFVGADENPRYCDAAIKATLSRVESAPKDKRGSQISKSAYALGQLVGAGALGHTGARALLNIITASWGEEEKHKDVIERALLSGARSPSRIPPPRDDTQSIELRHADGDDDAPPSVTVLPDTLTESDVASVFAREYEGVLRFCHSTGGWFYWDDAHWSRNEDGQAPHLIRALAHDLSGGQKPKVKATVRKRSFTSGVEYFARNDPTFAVTIAAWDKDPYLLGTPNGTVDLRTGEVKRADPVDGITKITSIAPSDNADCPLWLRFLAESTGDDAELIRFLQQWNGYCLTGDTREHALAFVHGDGGNGKSVFLNTASYILHDYATTASMDTFTASRSDKHPTDLAMLRGARLVTASETEEGRAWAESRIKQMTGGDPITARFMRQDFFTFQPQFKLCIVGNHQPALHSVDAAARRRFNIVPFTRKPLKPDRGLEAKLRGEAPAILRWMLEGCLDWQRNGLVRPASIIEATETYFAEQDVFGQWLKDACRVEPDNRSISDFVADLFKSWSGYAEASGERHGSQKGFVQSLTKNGFKKGQRVRGGQLYTGLQLLKRAEQDPSVRD
jgi:putative DNA primase/helicase